VGFFAPSLRQISVVGLLLSTVVLVCVLFSTAITDWSRLVYDRPDGSEIKSIRSVEFVDKLPLTPADVADIVDGRSKLATVPIQMYHLTRPGLSSTALPFADQIGAIFDGKKPERVMPNMDGKLYAFSFETDPSQLEGIDDPHLFFHRLTGRTWTLHANGDVIGSGISTDTYVAIALPKSVVEIPTRMTFVVESRVPSRLGGIHLTYGLTIRSAKEVAWAKQNLPAQHEYPRILAAVFLGVFALVGFAMACSTPKYTDVWAYSAFCAALALMIWKHTPFFSGSFDWGTEGISHLYDVFGMSFDLLFMITGVILNLTFFRIRGWYFNLIVGSAIVSAIYVFVTKFPGFNPDVRSFQAYAYTGQAVVVLLLFSQSVGTLIGFSDLYGALRKAKSSGIQPHVARIWRRIAYALVFTFGVGVMQYFYLSGLVSQSTTPGPDLFLLAGIVPAGLLLLLFSWTIGAANSERLQLAPSLDVIDELILEQGDRAIYVTDAKGKLLTNEFGHPVKREYVGVLAWFDLKGFTMTDALRKIDERHRVEVDRFFADVEKDISDLYHNLSPRLRFKWAGDELSWAYFARDRADADEIVARAFDVWRKHAKELTSRWKTDLVSRLGAHTDRAVVEAMAYVDVHVAFARLDEFQIKPGLFGSRADYDSPSYTRISRAFKQSTHARVAVFETAGRDILAKQVEGDAKSPVVEWESALSHTREAELRRMLEADPSRIKEINEELMLSGTGFLVIRDGASDRGMPTHPTNAA